jgi:methionine-rich copper-binding protein CopC
VAVFALASPLTASAHARYESSTPARGEILAVGPDAVEIVFTQEIQRIEGKYGIEVTKDRGPAVAAGPAVVNDDDRRRMSVPLQPDLSDGRYVVRWNNTSDEDGDPAEGAFSFYVNYEPNTVDLANDEQLAQIGEEATAAATPPAGETPAGAETPGTADTPESTPADAPTPPASDEEDDDGESSTSIALIVVGAIVLAAVLVGAGYFFLRGRGT